MKIAVTYENGKVFQHFGKTETFKVYEVEEGKVISINKKDNKVLVEGINMVTKHAKPSMQNQQGGILHQEAPIDLSNVMLLHNGKATRVGFKMDGDKKVRVAKATGKTID